MLDFGRRIWRPRAAIAAIGRRRLKTRGARTSPPNKKGAYYWTPQLDAQSWRSHSDATPAAVRDSVLAFIGRSSYLKDNCENECRVPERTQSRGHNDTNFGTLRTMPDNTRSAPMIAKQVNSGETKVHGVQFRTSTSQECAPLALSWPDGALPQKWVVGENFQSGSVGSAGVDAEAAISPLTCVPAS